MAIVQIGTFIANKFAFMLLECQIAQTTIIEVRAVIFHLSSLWVGKWGKCRDNNHEQNQESLCVDDTQL